MRFIKIFGIIAFVWSLHGCTTMELDESQIKSIKRIGLVVLIHDYYDATYVGGTVFNNKHTQIPYSPDPYIDTITMTSKKYLKSRGYEVSDVTISDKLKNDYKVGMSNVLREKLSNQASSSNIDAVVIFYDGNCYVSGPPNSFGQTLGLRVSGHGLARRASIPVQEYACLNLDIVKAGGYKHILAREHSAFGSYSDPYILNYLFAKEKNFEFSEYQKKNLVDSIDSYFKDSTLTLLKGSNL